MPRQSLFALSLGIAVLSGGLLLASSQAQTPAPAPLPPADQKLGVDPAIETGVLPNGLRYYIRANKTPEHRAELRLVVNAGSVLEDDDQRGYAHLIEHMAFEGTRHFPRATVISFMQSFGMGFGPHLNAETSFDDTIYQLQVPTDREGVLERSLEILHDWAHDVSFDAAAVDRERQIVTEEWRQGLGASSRVMNLQRPVLLQGSRYGDRLPIGKMDVVQAATVDRLKTFYSTWYRPDLMSVIVVGDFNRGNIGQLVKFMFADLTNPTTETPRPLYPVPETPGTRFSIVSDREQTTTSVGTLVLSPAKDGSTVGGYRREMTEQIFSALMSARFEELSRKPNAPFVAAGAERSLFLDREQVSALSAVVPETGVARGLETLLAELARVVRDGFTQSEFDRVKLGFSALVDRVIAQKDTRQSAAFAAEYIRAFTTGESLPSLEDEMALRRALMNGPGGITLAEVNALAAGWSPDRNRTVTVVTGQKAGVAIPTEATLKASLDAAVAKPLPAYVDAVVSARLMDTPPTAGRVTATVTKDPGITEWTLSNGAHVVVKPTAFIQDEIVFQAFGFGGTSLASDADVAAAETAGTAIEIGGLGKLSLQDLNKVLAGKSAHASPFFSSLTQGVTGSSTNKDLETLLQLVYLRFTAPREDPVAFGVVQTQLRTLFANQQARPETALAETLTKLMTQNHPRAGSLTAARLNEMNLDRSLAFYKARFADASGFTFVFVGSVDLATLQPLVEKYLGALPSSGHAEKWRDVGIRFPTGIAEATVEKGQDPKSEVAIVFEGPAPSRQADEVQLQALSRVLQGRLFSVLRQQLGGTYGVTASATVSQIPTSEYFMTIRFTCDPARTAELTTRVFDDIAALKRSGPSRAQVADIVQSFQRDFEINSQKNAWVLGQLLSAYETGRDAASMFTVPDLYNAISADSVQAAAASYLDTTHYVKATLMPEKK